MMMTFDGLDLGCYDFWFELYEARDGCFGTAKRMVEKWNSWHDFVHSDENAN